MVLASKLRSSPRYPGWRDIATLHSHERGACATAGCVPYTVVHTPHAQSGDPEHIAQIASHTIHAPRFPAHCPAPRCATARIHAYKRKRTVIHRMQVQCKCNAGAMHAPHCICNVLLVFSPCPYSPAFPSHAAPHTPTPPVHPLSSPLNAPPHCTSLHSAVCPGNGTPLTNVSPTTYQNLSPRPHRRYVPRPLMTKCPARDRRSKWPQAVYFIGQGAHR